MLARRRVAKELLAETTDADRMAARLVRRVARLTPDDPKRVARRPLAEGRETIVLRRRSSWSADVKPPGPDLL